MSATTGDERDDAAAEMIASPRGLVVLSHLCGEDPDVWRRRSPGPLDDPTAHPFGTRRPTLDTTSARPVPLDDPERLLVEVARAAAGHAWWGEGGLGHDAVAAWGSSFLAAGRELLSAPGAAWWGDDLIRDRQVLVAPPQVPPDLADRLAGQFRMVGPGYHGRIPQSLRTSRRLDERLPALELCDSEVTFRAVDGLLGLWTVRIAQAARVFEVHGPEDWRRLLARYPRRVPTSDDLRRWGVRTPESVVPDWPAFAEDFDGLHVSELGVLTAQGVRVEVDGVDAVLEDVDVDMTAWFRVCWGEPELLSAVTTDEVPPG